jgi:hypothetical protein
LLDRNPEVLERVQSDLCRGLKNPSKGRHGLTARQVVSAFVLMRIKNWDYRELRERIADGVTLRQFTELFVGAAVLANNLMKIGELLVKRAKRRVKRTDR